MGIVSGDALRVLVALSISSGLTTASAQTAQSTFEGTPFSVVYSATQSRAFVGYLDETEQFAKFADCKAPRGDGSSSLDIIEVTDCRDIPEASFVHNRQNVARINAVFPEALRSVYSDEYRRDASRANVLNVLFFGSFTGGAAAATGISARDAKNSLIAGQRLPIDSFDLLRKATIKSVERLSEI